MMNRPVWWVIILLFGLAIVSAILLSISLKEQATIQVRITEIVDVESGDAIQADIYVNGELVAKGVKSYTLVVNVPGKIEVISPGHHPWIIELDGRTDRTLSGPVKLHPIDQTEMQG